MIKAQPAGSLVDFANTPSGFECLKYSFYSRKAVTAGAWPNELNFFSDQQGVAGANVRTTNMTKPSAIGNPRRFLIQWITCDVYSIVAAEMAAITVAGDVMQVIRDTIMKVTLLDKEYLTIPTYQVPAGGGVWGSSGVAGATFVGNGTPDLRNALSVELPLEREASFSVSLLNPDGFTTAKDLKVEITLKGLLLRPRQ